ncbi:two-component system sensor histidine kinase VicK [Catalinimonas alkaloidigena]|uniref:sensor histidine kinase n=1 Tax=Catalinimonas alkaloidigena TaxID=1075417 RepID=UPI0024058A11|nr:hypothetical protein [Catalinimonas alkaloidigena]MDF9796976.1 two-component system sensor histidine kinase VicK [Catalinimonas alkaloidigena]
MHNLYKSIIDTIPIFFFLWDRKKKETIFISKKFFDYKSGSYFVPDKSKDDLRQYIHSDYQELYDNFFLFLSEKNNFHDKVELKAADNLPDIKWMELSTYPVVNKKQEVNFISGHISDITSDKAYTKVLENQVKGLDTVLFLMAHELSAPVANIMGLSEVLKYESKNGEHKNHLNFYDTIFDLGSEIQTITRGLIGLIELQKYQDSINLKRTNLKALLENCSRNMIYNKYHQTYEVDLHDIPDDLIIMVQEDQFSRAIEELLLYLQKHKYSDEEIKMHLSEEAADDLTSIAITSADIKLPISIVERVLQHNGRLELKDVKGNRFRGMLELIIAKDIIEKHKGKLETFDLDQHTGFLISIPKRKELQPDFR